MGLRLKKQKGPRRALHPWSQRAADLTWEPSRFPELQWAGQTLSSPLLLLWSGVWEGPSRLPLLISPASLLCPQGLTQPGGGLEGRVSAWELSRLPVPEWVGQSPSALLPLLPKGPSHLPLLFSPLPPSYAPKDPRDLEGALEGRGSAWELSRLPWPEWAGQTPSAPLLFLPQGPSRLPLLISPASLLCPQDPHGLDGALEWGGPAWVLSRLPGPSGPGDRPPLLSCSSWRVRPTCLLLPPQPQGCRSFLASTSPPHSVPLRATGSIWGSSHLLGHQSPPPAAGRRPSCGEMQTPRLPTQPS